MGLSPDDFDCSNAGLRYLIEGGETIALYQAGQSPVQGPNGTILKMRKWLAGNSEFYILLRNFFYYNDLIGRLNLWMGARTGNENSQIRQFLVPQPDDIQADWQKSFSYLKNLQRETDRDGVPLVLIPIPLKFEIDGQEFQYTLAASHLDPSQVDVDQPLREIRSFAEKEGIPLFDPREALRERNEVTPCYFVYDGHWIAEGIRAATESIAAQWKMAHLPPWPAAE